MRFNFRATITFMALLILATFGCQDQTVEHSANQTNSTIPANNTNQPADAVRKLKEVSEGDKYEIKIYPKGGHGTGIFDAGVGLQDLLEQFLMKSLVQ